MTNWISTTCEANNITIHYTRTGGNKPPVILLHGLMTNGLCWTHLARVLETTHDVIMPDSRGHGLSEVPLYGYRYEDLANDVTALITALGLSQPFLLGHSMGGMTAAVAAHRNPGLLRGLILADPSFISPELQRSVRDSDVADQHRKIRQWTLEEVIADAQVRHPGRSRETIELFAQARLQTSMAAFDVLTPPSPDFRQLVQSFDLPTLLLAGDKGIVSAAVASELQELNQKVQFVQVPNAGHSLHIDQPSIFATTVQQFLTATETTP